MHDGHTRTLDEAILWHGGEVETSRQYNKSLTPEDRHAQSYCQFWCSTGLIKQRSGR
ncbi:di-heme oxidoredictase family protein, partial [Microbulbifer okhotskensis]|uniref:di-heme oxidoredictase family protein n=1 Tax=Microbulbifer okhotskensis TaxID=2926617 RepID=UPI00359C9B87